MTFRFSKSPIFSCSRVTSGERAKGGSKEIIIYIPSKMYVKDDCVKFRVTSIAVAS